MVQLAWMEVLWKLKERQLHALNALKVFAILLVFNSHCANLYPISALATGGALGNSLFFVLNGYFVKIDTAHFFPWIKKKFIQLYPGLWLVSIVNAIVLSYDLSDLMGDFFALYIFPTGYWFVGGLLLFNVVIWFLEKYRVFDKFRVYSFIMLGLYTVCFLLFIDKSVWSVEDRNFFRMIYYFYIYSLGYCLKTGKIQLHLQPSTALAFAVFGFIGNIGWKFLLVKIPGFMVTQFMCQVFCIVFAVSTLIWGLEAEERYCRVMPEKLRKGLDFWSKYSLEIYFTQRIPQRLIALGFAFPLNMAVAVACTMLFALLLKKVVNPITGIFMRERTKQ
ncbi:MAG: acyltransferase family protein [Oscillospiraceae bacterium]